MEENGLFAVLISGKDYPDKAAAGMLHDVLEDFTKQYPSSRWATENPTFDAYAEKLKGFMKTWQDPRADNLTRTMKELEDTKGILFDTMDSLLQRGEKMSDLVEKSDKLSQASKMFYSKYIRFLVQKVKRVSNTYLRGCKATKLVLYPDVERIGVIFHGNSMVSGFRCFVFLCSCDGGYGKRSLHDGL